MLLALIDDATSRIMPLRFAASELELDYFRTIRLYLEAHGKPVANTLRPRPPALPFRRPPTRSQLPSEPRRHLAYLRGRGDATTSADATTALARDGRITAVLADPNVPLAVMTEDARR
jgi:hypothetical protein